MDQDLKLETWTKTLIKIAILYGGGPILLDFCGWGTHIHVLTPEGCNIRFFLYTYRDKINYV